MSISALLIYSLNVSKKVQVNILEPNINYHTKIPVQYITFKVE